MEQTKQKPAYMNIPEELVNEETIKRGFQSLIRSGILKSVLSAVVLLVGIALAFGAVSNTPKQPKNSNHKNLIQW